MPVILRQVQEVNKQVIQSHTTKLFVDTILFIDAFYRCFIDAFDLSAANVNNFYANYIYCEKFLQSNDYWTSLLEDTLTFIFLLPLSIQSCICCLLWTR